MKGVDALIATVFIIMISIVGIAIVLESSQPSVGRTQEIGLLKEGKSILTQIDNAVRDVAQEGEGSTRVLRLSVSDGSYFIDIDKNAVIFSMDSRSQIIGTGISKTEENVNMFGGLNMIFLNISYTNINVTGGGRFGRGYHALTIKNNGYDFINQKQIISVSLIPPVLPPTALTVQFNQDGAPHIVSGDHENGIPDDLNTFGGGTYDVAENSTQVQGASTAISLFNTSTYEGIGTSNEAWTNHVFFDPNNGRWHAIYINSSADILTASTDKTDGLTWTSGTVIDAGTYDYDDFDCELDVVGSTTYLHCVYSNDASDNLQYRRCELTGTSPFIFCKIEQTPFDSSLQGGDPTLDDVAYPRIAIDSNDCILIAFAFEDDSEATADEWEVVFLKESFSRGCGDGDWYGALDTETGFPIFSVQEDAIGYNSPLPLGLKSFGDLDAQIIWIDTDSTTSADLETIFFNGTSNSFGTQRTLDDDVEWATTYTGFSTVIIGDIVSTFAMDDGTTDLDIYNLTGRNGILSSQIDTGFNLRYSTSIAGTVKAVVDTKAPDADDIWVFGVCQSDINDICYIKSTNGGKTWGSQQTWIDDSGALEKKYISAYFNPENCDIMVRYVENTTSPFNIRTRVINTGSCASIFKVEVWHNSTGILYSGVLNSINATIRFMTNESDYYSLQIYDWTNSEWENCQSGTVSPLVLTQWWCSRSINPLNYNSSDEKVRIRINSTVDMDVGLLKEDYVQFYVNYVP